MEQFVLTLIFYFNDVELYYIDLKPNLHLICTTAFGNIFTEFSLYLMTLLNIIFS